MKIKVSKNRFQFLKNAYFIFCLIGFSWQAIYSSYFYFQFQVVSSIEIKMPFSTTLSAIHLCGKYYHFLLEDKLPSTINKSNKYDRASYVYAGVQNIFQVTPNITESSKFISSNDNPDITRYSTAGCICYKMTFKIDKLERAEHRSQFFPGFFINRTNFPASKIKIFLVDKEVELPWMERLLSNFRFVDNGVTLLLGYKITINKIKWPYTDNCVDYTQLGYHDNQGIISDCVDKILSDQNYSSCFKYYSENDKSKQLECFDPDSKINMIARENYQNAYNICQSTYQNPNCHRQITVTEMRSSPKEIDNTYYGEAFSDKTSLVVTSSPKIQLVDYVTFMLGAFGAWLGFSFLSFDPVNRWFENTSNTNKINRVCDMFVIDQLKIVNRKYVNLEKQISEMKLYIKNMNDQSMSDNNIFS